MKIPYSTLCPTCKQEGSDQKLYRDLDRVEEGVMCPKGHIFESTEAAEALLGNQPVVAAVPAVEEKPAPTQEEDPEPELAALDAMRMVPPPEVSAPTAAPAKVEVASAKEVALQADRAAKTAPVATLVEDLPMGLPEPTVQRPRAIRELAGGSLEIVLRIPDEHVNFCKGEAENQGKTLQEYMQDRFEFGLSSRWFY